MAAKKTVISIKKNGDTRGETIALDGNSPLRIPAIAGAKYQVQNDGNAGPDGLSMKRVGDDLQITLEGESEPAMVLTGYFSLPEPAGFYGTAEDGRLYAYARTDGDEIFSLADGEMQPVALAGGPVPMAPAAGDDGGEFMGFLPLMLGGGIALAGFLATNTGSSGELQEELKTDVPLGKARGIQVYDDKPPIVGLVEPGGVTDDEHPEFRGTGTPGNTIVIYDNGAQIGTATVQADGSWSFTPKAAMSDGSHLITVIERNPAGTMSDASDSFPFVIDTQAPDTPLLGQGLADVIDDVMDLTGSVPRGGLTNDNRPEFTGKGTPGDTILVFDGGKLIGQAVVGSDESWSFTPGPGAELSDGRHSITIAERDPAGNTSGQSEAWEFEVDTVKPAKPTLDGMDVYDDVGTIQGSVPAGGVTDDAQPQFSGKGTPGNTVILYDQGKEIGRAEVGSDGSWSFTPKELAEGGHSITLAERDPAGNIGDPSDDAFVFTVDLTPPDAERLAITGIEDGESGKVEAGQPIGDRSPVIHGTGTPGDTVVVSVVFDDDARVLGSAVVGDDGTWRFKVDEILRPGDTVFTVAEYDPAGNETLGTEPYPVVVLGAHPDSPSIENVQDRSGEVHYLQKGEITDDSRPTFTGTAQAGSTVKLYDGAVQIGEAAVDEHGRWSFRPEQPLGDGAHVITATATDADGRSSPPTSGWNFSIDTQAPDGVSELAVTDGGLERGPLASGDTTDDSVPTLSGKAEPGSKVSVYDGDLLLGEAAVDGEGNWRFTPGPLADGQHDFFLTVSDAAGNIGGNVGDPAKPDARVPDFTLVVDTGNVEASITAVLDHQDPFTGPLAVDGVTNDPRPEIQGKGRPGSTVIVFDGDEEIGSATVDGNGRWSFRPETDFAQGTHELSVQLVGSEGDRGAVFALRIDTEAPAVPTIERVLDDVGEVQSSLASGGATDDPSPTLEGRAEPFSRVSVFDGDRLLGSVAADADGHWLFTPTNPLLEGGHAFTVQASDAAGNLSDRSKPFLLTTDYTPPDAAKLAILGVEDDVGLVRGNIDPGGSTDDSMPRIHGTGLAGDTVIVMVKDDLGSRELGRTVVDADGNWSLQAGKALVSGRNEFTAIEMDPAGNKTAPSAGYAIHLDYTQPAVPVIENVQDNVGTVHHMQKGEVTDDPRPTVIGTAEPGNTVTIYDHGEEIGTVQADASGKWSFRPEQALAEGEHLITANASNAIGQTSSSTGGWNFVVDVTAPDPISDLAVYDDEGHTGLLASGDTTDDPTPTFSGKAEPGATVTVFDGASRLGDVRVGDDGRWSFTPARLPDGDHAFGFQVTDPAGNVQTDNPGFTLKVDTSGVTVSITAIIDNALPVTGPIPPGGVTNDSAPTMQGSGKIGSTITLFDGEKEIGRTMVKSDGSWSWTPADALGEGMHGISAVATDATQNTSAPTAVFEFRIDTQAPEAPVIERAGDDVGAFQSPLASGDATDDPSPTLQGTAEAGSKVSVYDNGVLLGTVDADRDGHWQYTPTTPRGEGAHDFTARATDAAGNTSGESGKFSLVMDFTPPDTKLAITGISEDTGFSNSDFVTSDTQITLDGSLSKPLAADEMVQVSVDGGASWHTARAAVGASDWHYDDPRTLPEGETIYLVRIVDRAGNVGDQIGQTVTVDTTAPTQTVSILSYVDDQGALQGEYDFRTHPSTDDSSPLLKGALSAALGARELVEVLRDGVLIGTATVTGTTWSFQDGDLVDGGHYLYTARVVDLAGNAGALSAPAALNYENSLVSVAAASTVVHESALWNGTGLDWLDGGHSTTGPADLQAHGSFRLAASVEGVTITVGGVDAQLSLADLANNPTVRIGGAYGDSLQITSLGNGQYSYVFTLFQPKMQDTSGGRVGETSHDDIVITATGAGGRIDSATAPIVVVNDEVLAASSDPFFVPAGSLAPAGVDITVVLDSTGSMAQDGGNGMSKWELAVQSLKNLLDQYDETYPDSTAFQVNIITFGSVQGPSASFTSFAGAKDFVDNLSFENSSTTIYAAGLRPAITEIKQSIADHPDWDQKVYFLTDGGGTVPADWKAFVNDPAYLNQVDVYAVAYGDEANTPQVIEVMKTAVAAGDAGDRLLQVADPTDLGHQLLSTLPDVVTTGNLFAPSSAYGHQLGLALGGDGGFTLTKVSIAGVDHVFGADDSMSLDIGSGMTMTLQKDGSYAVSSLLYIPEWVTQTMSFDIRDADGDTVAVTRELSFGFTIPILTSAPESSGLLLDGGEMHVDLSVLGRLAVLDAAPTVAAQADAGLAEVRTLLVPMPAADLLLAEEKVHATIL